MDRGRGGDKPSFKILSQVNVREERRETRSRLPERRQPGASVLISRRVGHEKSWPAGWVETYLLSGSCKTWGLAEMATKIKVRLSQPTQSTDFLK